MEKYSAYRDPGTGIQPFLPPVPPLSTGSAIETLLKPVNYILGLLRMLVVLLIGALYVVLLYGLCLPMSVMPSLADTFTHAITALLSRLCLLSLGFLWVNTEVVKRKRGRISPTQDTWRPKSGDIIVSNWLSYVEILWLAFRFNPIFVLPVVEPLQASRVTESPAPSPLRSRTGATSAFLQQSPAKKSTKRAKILGFRVVSLLQMLNVTGRVPPYGEDKHISTARQLDDIRSSERRPIVLLPECTTSNGRGLLRFARVFEGISVPVKNYNIFMTSVRIDPPTQFSPTISNSIPSRISWLNPLSHMFTLACSPIPHKLNIRMLALSDSPSSETFAVSGVPASLDDGSTDKLSEICATLIGEIGRMKKVGLGWEEKLTFLELYTAKTK